MNRQLDAPDRAAIDGFRSLINRAGKEQAIQSYLEAQPRLIPQEFIQNHGVHLSVIFRKLRLAENYITDFFYLAKSSGDWNAVFVEIEKPQTRFFRDKPPDAFHREFRDALDQVNTWRAWVGTRANVEHLLKETLEPIWQPRSMRSNPVYPKYVLVTGRRSEYESDDRRRKLIQSLERDDFKILSYDSLIDGYESNESVYLAERSNSKIKILSKGYVSENLFVYVDPRRLVIPKALANDAIAHRDSWRVCIRTNLDGLALDSILPKIEQV